MASHDLQVGTYCPNNPMDYLSCEARAPPLLHAAKACLKYTVHNRHFKNGIFLFVFACYLCSARTTCRVLTYHTYDVLAVDLPNVHDFCLYFWRKDFKKNDCWPCVLCSRKVTRIGKLVIKSSLNKH